MDTFDSINLGVFVLIYTLLVARMTFWKRHGELLSFQGRLPNFLLSTIACLSLSVCHHWKMPHRHDYELALAVAALLVTYRTTVERFLEQRRQAKEKQAQKAERRYY
jgi:hypothetical protein